MIAIIDYGLGNLRSVANMLKKIGLESVITTDPEKIKSAEKYLLCGVGAFDHGINNLKNAPFFQILENEVLGKKKKILGICLGMQLFTNSSEEGIENGLGWISAKTIKFDLEDKDLAIPHMGWNKATPLSKDCLFKNLEDNRFYFVHSYHVVCDDGSNILATANYGIEFTCSIRHDNIYGVQFHPEKSHKFGMQLLRNFGEI